MRHKIEALLEDCKSRRYKIIRGEIFTNSPYERAMELRLIIIHLEEILNDDMPD